MLKLALAIFLSLCGVANAQLAGGLQFPGPGTAHSAGGGAYVGPGDINGAAWSWVGLRGYSAAYSTGSNPAIDIVDQAGANSLTVNILSNGNLDVASISTWATAHTVTTIRVAKLYDQTGNGRYWSQATLASMPVLTLSGLGSKPTLDFDGSASTLLPFSNAIGTNTSGSTSTAFKVLSGGSNFQAIYSNNNGPIIVAHWGGTANQITLAGNSNIDVTAADGSFHAVQTYQTNGGTLSFYVDGSSNTLPTAGNFFGGTDGNISGGNGYQLFRGSLLELGLYTSDQSANNSAMNSNQRTYWGF